MTEKILFIDDEPNVLEGVKRSLKREFLIETAESGGLALKLIGSRGDYAVVVSDMRMPGMDGVQLLAAVREISPATVRVMLTGNADQQTAIEAVNEGHIFRFLTKPCPPEALAKALRACLHQYRLVMAEKELLEQTLRGSIQVLTDVISLVNPTAFGRASRVRRLVRQLAEVLKIESAWQAEVAAMLSQVGCITVPEETLAKVYKGTSLTAEELVMLRSHPKVGRDLIANIPRLEEVAEIISYQEKLYNGVGGLAGDKRGSAIPLGGRLLKVALDFDKLVEGKFTREEAYEEIKQRGDWYDPRVVEALKSVVEGNKKKYQVMFVRIRELDANMILAEDIKTANGLLLISEGQDVNMSLRLRLENFLLRGGIKEPIKVFVPAEGDAGDEVNSLPEIIGAIPGLG